MTHQENTHGQHCGCEQNHHHEQHCDCGHEHSHETHCGCGQEHFRAHVEAGMEKTVYILENLGCANCAAKMEAKIRQLPGVGEAVIVFPTKQLRLTAHHPERLLPQIQQICASIESQVVVTARKPKHEEESHSGEWQELALGAGLFLLGLLIPAAWLKLTVFVAGYLILGGRVLLEAGRNLRKGHVFDENFLMSVATLGAFAIGEYPEALGVMLFYRVGEFFEHRAVTRSRSQIMEAIDLRPETVNRIRGDATEVIPAEEAMPGDWLLIRPGDRIPLDGLILHGNSRLDTAPITGEPVPVAVKAGDRILSGCVNGSGQLVLKVEKPLSQSMVSRILDCVENAAASKPKLDRFITRFARVYTPVVLAAALLTAVVPSLVSGEWNYWVYTALSFLVMSCPCALVLSVPLAFFSGIGVGSGKGILFKGGASLEALCKLKAVVMDKTGTLTKGEFKLQQITSFGTYTPEQLLRLCAGCEQHSTHPIGVSITAAAREQGLQPEKPASLEEIPGEGIAAVIGGRQVLCGNGQLMERFGIAVQGDAQVFLAVDGKPEGSFRIADGIKEDAPQAISALKKMGLHTAILTGDTAAVAEAVARELEIDEVHGGLLPQQKLEVLQNIRSQKGAVMFVGDGINDAPVLAGADVGAAMGSGADAALEAADAVFMTSAADSIPEAIRIARQTYRVAVQNVVVALTIKLVVMALGLLGFANMWLAVFADSGVALLCVLNSIRILYKERKK